MDYARGTGPDDWAPEARVRGKVKSTDARDEHRAAPKFDNKGNFRGIDDATREAVMRHECADRVSMASLGLGERPSDLNQWIDDEAAELAARLATLEKPIHVGAVQSMIAEFARGAALYVISDRATLITNLANGVHRANVERGWWNDPMTGEDLHGKRNIGELLALVHSEISEATEGSDEEGLMLDDILDSILDIRNCHLSRREKLLEIHKAISRALEGHRKKLMDDKLPHRPTFRVELIDALIRILDTLGSEGNTEHPAGVIFVEKDDFNASREDHKPENRVKEGGKAF